MGPWTDQSSGNGKAKRNRLTFVVGKSAGAGDWFRNVGGEFSSNGVLGLVLDWTLSPLKRSRTSVLRNLVWRYRDDGNWAWYQVQMKIVISMLLLSRTRGWTFEWLSRIEARQKLAFWGLHVWWPEFNSWNQHDERREQIRKNYLLTSAHVLWHT